MYPLRIVYLAAGILCIVYLFSFHCMRCNNAVTHDPDRPRMACNGRVDDTVPNGDHSTTNRRVDYIALSQDPLADVQVLYHVHHCPDVSIPSFPFGPLLRDTGVCAEPIPFCCAFCMCITFQPCRNTYRVANTGADWNEVRNITCTHQEIGVLVQCAHCHAPSDFHLQLALFKEYYEEVFDMVRDGRVTLFDLRRSVAAVSFWPPRSGASLARRLSRVASQVAEAISMDTALPTRASALVFEYWQGVGHDFLSPTSSFTESLEMYQCTHAWPCANHASSTRACMWTRWAQHWLNELHLCDLRARFALPRTWEAWVGHRLPDWRGPASMPSGTWGRHDAFGDGDAFLTMAAEHHFLGPVLRASWAPFQKPEDRRSDAWYTPSSVANALLFRV